jgi:hypothetical protein
MKQIQISGRMTVRTLKQDILETFGLLVQVIHQAELAKDTDTLATISLKRGNISTEKLIIRANTLVANFEKLFLEKYGIVVQVIGNEATPDKNITLKKWKEKHKVYL